MYRIMNPSPKQTTPLDTKRYPKIYDEESRGTVQRIYIQYPQPTHQEIQKSVKFRFKLC